MINIEVRMFDSPELVASFSMENSPNVGESLLLDDGEYLIVKVVHIITNMNTNYKNCTRIHDRDIVYVK